MYTTSSVSCHEWYPTVTRWSNHYGLWSPLLHPQSLNLPRHPLSSSICSTSSPNFQTSRNGPLLLWISSILDNQSKNTQGPNPWVDQIKSIKSLKIFLYTLLCPFWELTPLGPSRLSVQSTFLLSTTSTQIDSDLDSRSRPLVSFNNYLG